MDDDNNKNDLTDLNDISDFIHDEGTDSELSDFSDDFLSNEQPSDTTAEFDPTGVHDFSDQSFNQMSEEEATSLFDSDENTTDQFSHSSDEDTKFFTPGTEVYDDQSETNDLESEKTSQWEVPGNTTLETDLMEDTGLRENFQQNQEEENTELAMESSSQESETENFQFDTPSPEKVQIDEDPLAEESSPVDLSLLSSAEEVKFETQESKVTEPVQESQPIMAGPISDQKENFSDVKKFAENMVIGDVQTNANPPYSILLTGLEDQSCTEEIIGILKEHELADENHEDLFRNSLSLGTLLISQISEYSAVVLAHKLRRFNAQLKVGLSALLHSPKNYEGDSFKIQTAESLFQNKSEHEDFSETSQFSEIFHSNLDHIEGHQVIKYLGIVHVEKLISAQASELEKQSEIYKDDVFSELDKKARKKGANALLGMRFQTQQASTQSLIIQATATAVFLRKRKNLDAGPGQNL